MRTSLLLFGLMGLMSCVAHTGFLPMPPEFMLNAVTEQQIRSFTKYISDPLLEGRGVGSRGESLAAKYVESVLSSVGVQPAGTDGYFQYVGMKGTLATYTTALNLAGNGYSMDLAFATQYALTTQTIPSPDQLLSLTQDEVVFVGYGIVASEYGWNDYKNVDVAGKVALMFVSQPTTGIWANKSLTYYGRWTYKFEEAARHNVKAAILIHTDVTATYPWSTVRNSWANTVTRNTVVPSFPLKLHGWIHSTPADALATAYGYSLSTWFSMAEHSTFQPIAVGTASVDMKFSMSYFNATSVIGMLPGSYLADEAVVISGHIDHLGIKTTGIMPGALDNASGASITLLLAKIFASFKQYFYHNFQRTVVFFFPTAEESGLLGSDYFLSNVPAPLEDVTFVADFNYDIANAWGRSYDVSVLGKDYSTLNDLLEVATFYEGMHVSSDPLPANGFFYRGDQFSFAKAGVPSVWLFPGSSFIGQPSTYFQTAVNTGYFNKCYHNTCDKYSDSIDFSGMVQQARVGLRAAYALAQSNWKPTCHSSCY